METQYSIILNVYLESPKNYEVHVKRFKMISMSNTGETMWKERSNEMEFSGSLGECEIFIRLNKQGIEFK